MHFSFRFGWSSIQVENRGDCMLKTGRWGVIQWAKSNKYDKSYLSVPYTKLILPYYRNPVRVWSPFYIWALEHGICSKKYSRVSLTKNICKIRNIKNIPKTYVQWCNLCMLSLSEWIGRVQVRTWVYGFMHHM